MGWGKSNLIEAIDLLRSTPSTAKETNLLAAIRDGGGVRDWLWKGAIKTPHAEINAVFDNPKGPVDLRYVLSFSEVGQRFEILDERIENSEPDNNHSALLLLSLSEWPWRLKHKRQEAPFTARGHQLDSIHLVPTQRSRSVP